MNPASRSDPIRAWLASRAARGDMPGAAWWVGDVAGESSAGAVGAAAVEPAVRPAHPETVYDLASLTKPLATATLAVLLERDRALDLDAPAAAWLPELDGGPYAGVTLVDLGRHRAGLPAWKPLYLEAGDREGYATAIAAQPPAGPRGAELYSDLGYVLLGLAVERAAGENLGTLFRERIAMPLDLARIGFGVGAVPGDEVAPTERGNAYERRLGGEAAASHRFREHVLHGEVHDANAFALGGVAGHAGLFGAAREVASIAREWLEPERLALGDRARALLLRAPTPDAGRTFGLEVAAASTAARGVLPDLAVGHVGFTGTSVWVDPDSGRILVLLANRVHPVVREGGFQEVRAGFHRAAWRRLDGLPGGSGAGD